MAGHAALLIDLENFYIGREENYNRTHAEELYEFAVDLDSLCSFAGELAGNRRLLVRRAYANFNDRRPGEGDRRWDYYLQPLPRFLMEQGIEPMQVFRFPGGSNKNAADMRLAMDAMALSGRQSIDQFILVTGDSDFIPVVLELRTAGAEVVVIGVANSTKSIFARYCDRFEYFEDLLAAREARRESMSELEPVRAALRGLLEKKAPIKFAAVKPLLSDALGQPFDPSRFGCETTGEFLRKFDRALGIGVWRGEHDWEIGAPEAAPQAAPAPAPAAETTDACAPTNGDETVALPVALAPADMAGHPEELYRDVLRQGTPRCYVVSNEDWRLVTDAVFRVATGGDPAGERPHVFHQEMLNEVTEACADRDMQEAGRKVRDVMFQLFKAGCFHCADEGAEAAQIDFHWSRPAVLDAELKSVEDVRRRAWAYLVRLLSRRLEQRGKGEEIDVDALARLFAGPEPSAEERQALDEIVQATRVKQET